MESMGTASSIAPSSNHKTGARRLKILHVTESFGGGVTSAINSYVFNAQQHQHYLFASVRDGDATGEENQGLLHGMELVPRRLSSLMRLRQYIGQLQPDVIHLHSTYAGAIARMLPFVPARKLVYTPHGFAFLRGDHPLLLRTYQVIETLLARRTAVIAGCGLDEQRIAQRLIDPQRTLELINVCDDLPEVTAVHSETSLPVVGMVGRVARQKGHAYFREVAQACRGVAHFKWIGGGEADATQALLDAGVEVTGWITRPQVLAHMKGLDLYFHSAAWDGFPISVLEAAKLDLPILLRRIGPFVAEDLATLEQPAAAALELKAFAAGDSSARERARDNCLKIQRHHSAGNLQQALETLYSRFT